LPRHRRQGLRTPRGELNSVEVLLVGLGVGAGFSAITAYLGTIPLPGRPVKQEPLTSIALLLQVLVLVLGAQASAIVLRRAGRLLGAVVLGLYSLVLLGQWWAPFLASILVLLVFPEQWIGLGASASLLPAALLVLRPLSIDAALAGSAIGFGEIIVGLIIGVVIAVLIVFAPPRRQSSSRVGERARSAIGLGLLLASIVSGLLAILVPHVRYGFSKIISYDTYYNMRFCELYRQGEYTRAFFSWQRPLYVLVVTIPAVLTGCKPWFFDVVVPLLGFTLLAIISWLLVLKETGSALLAGLGSLLAIGYWVPFFLYAGLQTNLLGLPAALLLAYYLLDRRKSLHVAATLSLFLGLWHPWTLAYYTLAAALMMAIQRRNILELSKRVFYILVPGWIAYSIVAFIAGRSGVVGVARGGVSRYMPFLWNLKIYFWGVMMRPEVIVPVVLALASLYLTRRGASPPAWILGASILGFLGALLPNTKLLVRFLVDAPLPLLLSVLGLHGRRELRALIIAVTASTLMLLYLVTSIRPVIKFPH